MPASSTCMPCWRGETIRFYSISAVPYFCIRIQFHKVKSTCVCLPVSFVRSCSQINIVFIFTSFTLFLSSLSPSHTQPFNQRCGNTYKMLHDTRLKEYFDFVGTWDHHYGIFEGCGSSLPYTAVSDATGDKGASTGGCC